MDAGIGLQCLLLRRATADVVQKCAMLDVGDVLGGIGTKTLCTIDV